MKIKHLQDSIYLTEVIIILLCSFSLNAQVSLIQPRNTGLIAGSLKDGPTVSLQYKDTLSIPSFTEFNIPVIMKEGSEISAISLGFYYPGEYLEIMGMEMPDNVQGFSYSAVDGLFRMAWSDIDPINIMDEGTVMILKMKSTDLSLLNGAIRLGIDESSEFADSSANVIEAVILEIPEIQYLSPDPEDSLDGNYVLVYPNPFNDFTTINFYLKADSKVKISLFNPAGMKILQMPDANYPQGTYQVKLYAIDLSKGIFILKFEIINEDQSNSRLIKILVTR